MNRVSFDRELMSNLSLLTMKETVMIFSQMKEDKLNNASDDSGNIKLVNQPQ